MDGDGGEVQHEALDPIEAEIIELERELCRLPEVSAARIVTDRIGRPTEVHILAQGDKHPKQIVRDIQSVALASFGIEIDRRIVSVVQLGAQAGTVSPQALENPVRGGVRAVLRQVTAENNGLRSLVRVTLAQAASQAAQLAAPTPLAITEQSIRQTLGGDDQAAARENALTAVRIYLTSSPANADQARTRAEEAVARARNIPPDQARAQVQQFEQQYRQAVDQTRQQASRAADTAARAGSTAALFGAIGLLLGAIAGWLGGRMGTVEPTITRHFQEAWRGDPLEHVRPVGSERTGATTPPSIRPAGTPVCFMEKTSGAIRGGARRPSRCELDGVEIACPSPPTKAPSASIGSRPVVTEARPRPSAAMPTWVMRSAP